MSLVEFLLDSRTKLELAKELAAHAKENAALKNRVFLLENTIFWMEVAERNSDFTNNAPVAPQKAPC